MTVRVRDWLAESPFALALSAGFFGFFAHAGFVAALEEAGLAPSFVTGASAGALVGGLWASGTPAARIEAELRPLRREHFWDPAPGFGLLRGALFRARVEAMLAAPSFERARTPVALSAFDVRARRTVVLGSGDLARAICASCAFPVLLQPVDIGGRAMLDGGIADRPGHAGLPPGGRVLFHHLASKSPWRREDPAIPKRADMVTITLAGLPRLGPFRLARGGEVFDRTREAARRTLDAPFAQFVSRDA
jgi:NTE family protein